MHWNTLVNEIENLYPLMRAIEPKRDKKQYIKRNNIIYDIFCDSDRK